MCKPRNIDFTFGRCGHYGQVGVRGCIRELANYTFRNRSTLAL
ncbi:MAG: hypothetical protein ACP5UB_09065 [Candidatus Sumerlaeaceae bacterium]